MPTCDAAQDRRVLPLRARARAYGDRTGTSLPVTPSITTSGIPPTALATTGTPASNGSSTPPQFSESGTWTAQSKSGQLCATSAGPNIPGRTTRSPANLYARLRRLRSYHSARPKESPIRTPCTSADVCAHRGQRVDHILVTLQSNSLAQEVLRRIHKVDVSDQPGLWVEVQTTMEVEATLIGKSLDLPPWIAQK